MAELAIKIGGRGTAKDQDIIHAFNDLAIRWWNAMMICRDYQPDLLQVWREKTFSCRFDRISRTEYRRTVIVTGKNRVIGLEPNEFGEYVHMQEFVDGNPGRFFGEAGNETWFGGDRDYSSKAMDAVWAAIEAAGPYRETDFRLFPAGSGDLKAHLFLRVDDFDDATRRELEEPDLDAAGKVVAYRKRRANWRKLPVFTSVLKTQIDDPRQSVDIRSQLQVQLASIVEVKSLVD